MNNEKTLTARELLERVYGVFRKTEMAVIVFKEEIHSTNNFIHKDLFVLLLGERDVAVSLGIKNDPPSAEIVAVPVEKNQDISTGIEKLIFGLQKQSLFYRIRTGEDGQGIYASKNTWNKLQQILPYGEVKVCSECAREFDNTMPPGTHKIRYKEILVDPVFSAFVSGIDE